MVIEKVKEEIYNNGMIVLRSHVEELIHRVMKSRREGKGNFTYLDSDDFRREQELATYLEFFLWRLYCELNDLTNSMGHCDGERCYDCTVKRYNFHSKKDPDHWNNEDPERWFCQRECECK